MTPLEITIGGSRNEIGAGGGYMDFHKIGKRVSYSGDETSTATISNIDGTNPVSAQLAVNQSIGVDVNVNVAPVEPGEPLTPVVWQLNTKRI